MYITNCVKNPRLVMASALVGGTLVSASGGAFAQSASAQAMLEEVVVTARRREENLQDLPLSIAAINGDAMQAQGIHSIEDVSDFVPNVTLTTADRANNTRIVIRGIGGGHPDPVFVFGSGMYIDGHYIPNSLGGYMSTIDIERVELLRGPQGTLFGKNVTGGAVNIVTTKPGPEFDSSITLRAAEDGDNDFRGMVNFPISENVFGRVSIAKEVFDGYYFNRNLNVETGGEDLEAIHAAVRFTPTDNWTIDASINLQKRRDDNKGVQCNDFDGSAPQWGGGTGHLERIYVGATADFKAACNADAAIGPFVNSSDKITWSNIDQEGLFFSAQWESDGAVGALDSLTVKTNASYRYNEYTYLQDRDGTFFAVDAVGSFGEMGSNNETHGAELLVEADVNDRLSFTAGVNYFEEIHLEGTNSCYTAFAASGAAADPTVTANCPTQGLHFELLPGPRVNNGGPGPFMSNKSVWNDSLGVFGHLTYNLSDNWDLDFGARWTEDDRKFNNIEWASTGCSISDDPALRSVGNTSLSDTDHCDITVPMTQANVIDDGFFNKAADTFSEVTPMISITRHLAGGDLIESGMVYALYSEGFLTGGFNTEINSNLPAVAPLLTYEPEHVANYELGFKGTLADGRVRVMADVFFMDYTDKQDSVDIANPTGAFGIDDPLGIVQNVSSVEIKGVEFELRASPWDGGFVSVDFGYLSNKYGDYSYVDPATGTGLIDASNTTIADLTPEWTLNLGIEHEFQLSNGGTLTPRLNIYSQDDYDYEAASRDAPPSLCNQDAYTKVGARMTYVPADGNWQASIFGQNITDELIYEACGTSRGVYRYRHERPAYWGVEYQARWGAGAN